MLLQKKTRQRQLGSAPLVICFAAFLTGEVSDVDDPVFRRLGRHGSGRD
jgi:hypothetical protein